VPGLGTALGFGAATAAPRDLSNSDCILIMGSNMAESHPVGFHWPVLAHERGAVLIHVDPRFTRTSALADVFVKIRPGTDIAFLGGIIRYIIENERFFREYIVSYTNAATIISGDYTDNTDGLFAGFDAVTGRYDLLPAAWEYDRELAADGSPLLPRTDPSLQDPRCVLQILKRHYARYTPEKVAGVCGCRPQDVIKVAELLCRNSCRERTSAVAYALGWTQHSTGSQMIRAASIVQLLLGNIGRPGGGILALRGHACIQGATDIPVLFDMLPAYLPSPRVLPGHDTLAGYLDRGRSYLASRGGSEAGQWQEDALRGAWADLPKFTVSLLKAWYGDAATADNDFGFTWLPRLDEDLSEMSFFLKMHEGKVRGAFLMGENPAAGGPNARLHREAMRRLDWLVVVDLFETESASFWHADPQAADPANIATEVFLMPAAAVVEKDGSLTNTERMLQWHERAVAPPGDCQSDARFVYELGRRIKALYRDSTLERDAPIRNLTWSYEPDPGAADAGGAQSAPDASKVLREINGFHVATRRQLRGPDELRSDGSTACGCWLYCGVHPEEGNRAHSRDGRVRGGSVYSDWAWTWPENRRVLYNRASADPEGRPWSDRKKLVWWDEKLERWTGNDAPDFEADKRPDYRPSTADRGMAAIAGDAPFRMHPDGRGWLFVPYGLKDGPLPVHYEPVESPYRNALVAQQSDPLVFIPANPKNPIALPCSPDYPLVATTYRLTEHYLSGAMSRFDSWLNELQPALFVEIGPALARERGVNTGDWVVVSSPRGQIEVRALVTPRLAPVVINGRFSHTVGLPIHWGYSGETVGATINDLTPMLLETNAGIHESKSFVCQLRAGRLEGAPQPVPLPLAPRPASEIPVPQTPKSAQPLGSFGHGK
jgi:formate dehydrogenase major subunit